VNLGLEASVKELQGRYGKRLKMGTSERFSRFLASINLSSSDREDAKRKYDGVAGKLHKHFYGNVYNGSTKLLIGSYGKRTSVIPPRDVDLLFLMPSSVYYRYDSYAGNGQSQLLQDIKKIIQGRYPTTDKIRGDGQVVVVPFGGGHTIELLPAWKTESGKFIIPHTRDGGSWKVVDHAAEFENVDASDKRSNGNTRSLIKMMKTWQSECGVPIKSLVLELRAVNFLATWRHYNEDTYYYDWMVRDYLDELIKNADNYCKIPGISERCNYGNLWLSKAQSAYGRALRACQYEANSNDTAAVVEWRKIFGTTHGR
jgi:hypothetical protein